MGLSAAWSFEASHDPFLPLALASERTESIELGTAIAVAFARNPMTCAVTSWDLHRMTGGRFILGLGTQIKPHITKRFSEQWSHPAERMREYIEGRAGHLAHVRDRRPAQPPRRVLHPHPDDGVLQPRPPSAWRRRRSTWPASARG